MVGVGRSSDDDQVLGLGGRKRRDRLGEAVKGEVGFEDHRGWG